MGKGLFSWLHMNTPSLPKLSNDTYAVAIPLWWDQEQHNTCTAGILGVSLATQRIIVFPGREWMLMAVIPRVTFELRFQHKVKLRVTDGLSAIESHCPVCGAFIAASPHVKLIQIAERFHSCAAEMSRQKK